MIRAIDAFTKQTGIAASGVYDNTMVLVNRIVDKGERPDIFISPGGYEVHFLADKGIVEPDSGVAIGSYVIELVVPKGNPAGVKSLEDLTKPEVKSIGLGNPDTNSIGYFTRQSLQNLGLWDKISKKVSASEHPVMSFEWVVKGTVQATFSFNACPLESNPEKLAKQNVEVIQELPDDSYDIPAVTVVILKGAAHKDAAQKFVKFLREESTLKMLAENGLPNQRNLDLSAALPAANEAGGSKSGGKEAKVVINAFYPASGDHLQIFDMVRKFEKEYPGLVKVNCYDIRDPLAKPEDWSIYRKSGLTCAGIQINGKSDWMLKEDGKLTEVALLKSPWVGGWTEKDLEAAVAQALAEGGSGS
jgi:molybdate transport system substrate-binding protein